MWGLPGSGGAICTLNFKLWIDQKLHRIILLHIGLVFVNFHFPEMQTVMNFMISAPVESPWPQTPLFLTLDTSNYSKEYKENTKSFWRILSLEIPNSWKYVFVKRRALGNLWDQFNKFLKISNMVSISFKKHDLPTQLRQIKQLDLTCYLELIPPPQPIPIATTASASPRPIPDEVINQLCNYLWSQWFL